jgi:hypothetical protein
VRIWFVEKVLVPENRVSEAGICSVVEGIDVGLIEIGAGSNVADIYKSES